MKTGETANASLASEAEGGANQAAELTGDAEISGAWSSQQNHSFQDEAARRSTFH
ncbi:MAG: hypothetical protein WKF30_09790 [Pyrinomonadaceae bacterium]